MDNTSVAHSVKVCVVSGMFFIFNHDVTLCHNIFLEEEYIGLSQMII